MTHHRSTVGLVALLMMSCVASTAPLTPEAACPGGTRPQLSDCVRGRYFAECGGTQSARFACDDTSGSCLWFTGGCVAANYHESGCTDGDICCYPSTSGSWAFEDDWRPAYPHLVSQTIEDVGTFGDSPVSREAPSAITVRIDPSVGAPSVGGVTCEGDVVFEICEADTVGPIALGGVLVFTIQPGGSNTTGLVIEVVPQEDGGLIARAFPHYLPDAPPREGPSCEQAHIPSVPADVSGTLVLSHFETASVATIHGQADLEIGASGRATLRF